MQYQENSVLKNIKLIYLLGRIFQVEGQGKKVVYLFHLKKPPSLKVVMAKWFYHKNREGKTEGRFFVWQSPITVCKMNFYRNDFYARGNKKNK